MTRVSKTSYATRVVLSVLACASLFGASGTARAFTPKNVSIPATATGHVLYHPDIILIFWGAYYANSSSATSAGKVAAALQQLTHGAFFSKLQQYNNIGYPRITEIWIDQTDDPCGSATSNCIMNLATLDAQIVQKINSRMTKKTVAAPSASAEQIYTVILRPGLTVSGGGRGRHDKATSPSGVPYYYAWGTNSGSMTAGPPPNSPPTVSITHELVETMTDPDLFQGWWDLNSPTKDEIGDFCNGVLFPPAPLAPAYGVQAYWSQADGQCVEPYGYLPLYQYSSGPASWTAINPPGQPAADVEAGPWGLVVTDTANSVWKYNGSGTSWTLLSAPPAGLLAVANDSVYATSTDLFSGAFRWNGSNWDPIGGLPATLSGGGAGLFATDYLSNSFFLWGGGTWNLAGGPAANFTINGTSVVALTSDHSSVLQTSNGSWIQIGTLPSSEVFSAFSRIARTNPVSFSSNSGTTPPSTNDNLYTPTGGTSWTFQGPPSCSVAVASEGLYRLAKGAQASRFLTAQPPQQVQRNTSTATWSTVSDSASRPLTRLISGGTTLFATGPAVVVSSSPNK